MARRRSRLKTRYGSLSSVVRFLRIRHGLSQQALCTLCGGGLCPNDISKIERGDYNVRLRKVCLVATYFQIPLQAIAENDFHLIGSPPIPEESENMRRQAQKKRRRSQAVKDDVGELGQKLVVRWERERLRGSGLEAHVTDAYANDEKAGFDVFSFTKEGCPLFIEVKSSSGAQPSFFLSENERRFTQYCCSHRIPYYLYSIKNVYDERKRSVVMYTAEEVLNLSMEPTDYLVKEK